MIIYTRKEVEEICDNVFNIKRETLCHNLEHMSVAKSLEEDLQEYQMGLLTTGEIVHIILDLMINEEEIA